MYMILCYDVGTERVGRVHKAAKKYLHPVQKSVFEGTLTESELQRLKTEIARLIEPEQDAVAIYRFPSPGGVMKEQIGTILEKDYQFL